MEYRGRQFVFEESVRLGGGGMAEVYLGVRVDGPIEHVAFKMPSPDLHPDFRALFLREAEAAQRVSHPNIVKVIDWGADPDFIAFEYIEGTTLDKVISARQGEQRLWTEAELLGMFRQLVAAMEAINEHVVHRDLKPANVFLKEDGLLKVSDFGISKFVGEGARSRTFKGWGTLPYMAPESWTENRVDWAVDQYSLGIVFYELATLQRPFVGSEDELRQQHLFQRPRRITDLVPGLSERLATLVARMLEKQVDRRFPNPWVCA